MIRDPQQSRERRHPYGLIKDYHYCGKEGRSKQRVDDGRVLLHELRAGFNVLHEQGLQELYAGSVARNTESYQRYQRAAYRGVLSSLACDYAHDLALAPFGLILGKHVLRRVSHDGCNRSAESGQEADDKADDPSTEEADDVVADVLAGPFITSDFDVDLPGLLTSSVFEDDDTAGEESEHYRDKIDLIAELHDVEEYETVSSVELLRTDAGNEESKTCAEQALCKVALGQAYYHEYRAVAQRGVLPIIKAYSPGSDRLAAEYGEYYGRQSSEERYCYRYGQRPYRIALFSELITVPDRSQRRRRTRNTEKYGTDAAAAHGSDYYGDEQRHGHGRVELIRDRKKYYDKSAASESGNGAEDNSGKGPQDYVDDALYSQKAF